MGELISVTDGRIFIRPPQMHDAGPLLAEAGEADYGLGIIAVPGHGRDGEQAGDAVGWVACDQAPAWLEADEVLLRYSLQAIPRQRDYALRVVQLLMHHLATRTTCRTALIAVKQDDARSLAVAQAAGFARRRTIDGDLVLARPVPPVTYSDGTVTIRRQRTGDIDRHLEAIDDAQIDWLWEPGHRQQWEALTADQRREHQLAHLRASEDSFGSGPKWCFSADRADASYIAYVDCDLANEHVPPGEANISYAGHPACRGQGNVSRSIRLLTRFLRDHTGARSAHLIVDADNAASLRVARAVAGAPAERWRDARGRTMVRHVLALR
ncbi:MAG TPA: GNAT family protein [Streptosporangiaceae bacterium]|nr:GNAT family protein [Streptosporangiaceae bacterium]